jgi:hypothetical protein
MTDHTCLVQNCKAKTYVPAGTQALCKEHFLNFLTWRRRKGAQMFTKYAGMSMEARDTIVAEWQKTVRVEELIPASIPKQ